MRNVYELASKALYERLSLSLTEGLSLFDDAKQPTVTYGIGSKRPPFHVWVNPLARAVSTGGSVSGHEYRTEFAFYVYLTATHTDLDEAVRLVNMWAWAAYMGVSAEATLGRSVDLAIPRVSDSGYDTTPDKKHIAVIELEVTCTVTAICPQEFKEMVRNAQSG